MLCGVELVCGVKVIRTFAIHELLASSTLKKVFEDVCKGFNDAGDGFMLDAKMMELPIHSCQVAKSQKDLFMTIPLTSTVKEASAFGIMFRYRIVEPESNIATTTTNAFSMMMQQARKVHLPPLIATPRNKRYVLQNDCINWLSSLKMGWTNVDLPQGRNFVSTITEILWKQRPTQESVWTTLRRDPHWKCLILTLLMHGCLATITWCRVTEVTKVIINYDRYPIKSTWRVSPCDDGYIYIPLAFLVMLYLVYLVECWHCPARLDLHYGVSVSEVYEKLRLLRDALPVIWWKAICYHYIRRTRQVTRYRNGDAYTTTQVYYERINSHSSSATFVFSQCGVKDISKKLLDLEKYPATKIRFSKSFAFANLEAANEFEEQRSRFFQDNERHDDYMEMREGLDLTQGAFREGLTAFADRLPWYLSHAAFWLASAFLFSWPLRVLLTAKTAHVHYHVIKLFGVNYSSVTGPPGSLIPTYGFLTPSGTVTSAELEWSIRNNFTVIPSYSEALLMEAESGGGEGGGQRCSLLRHHSSGSVLVHHNNASSATTTTTRTHLVRAFSSTGLAPPPTRRDSVRRQSTGRPHHRHSWGVFPCRGNGLRPSVTRFSLQGERCVYHPLPLAEASPDSSPALKVRAQPDDPPDYEVAIRVCRPLAPAPNFLRRSVTERDLQHRTSNADPSRRNSDATASSDIETAL